MKDMRNYFGTIWLKGKFKKRVSITEDRLNNRVNINSHPHKEIISEVMSAIFCDDKLMTPVYVSDFYCSADSQYLNEYPLIYTWTSQETGNTMSSVNGNGVSKILESFISKNDTTFIIIRDALIAGLSEVSRDAVKGLCETTKSNPQDIFANYSINTLRNAVITSK